MMAAAKATAPIERLLRRPFQGRFQLRLSWSAWVCSSSSYRSMPVSSALFWHAAGMTNLEGFECGSGDQYESRSDGVSACLLVTVNRPGSLFHRARNGHVLAGAKEPTEPSRTGWLQIGHCHLPCLRFMGYVRWLYST